MGVTTTEKAPRGSLRPAIAWAMAALAFAVGLSYHKAALLEDFARRSTQSLEAKHRAVLNLFQASFYFFYEDQFLPGVRAAIEQTPRLERVQVLAAAGGLIFDSQAPVKSPGAEPPRPFGRPEVISRLSAPQPVLFTSGFSVQVLMPAGQYGVLYTFDGSFIRDRLLAEFLAVLASAALLAWLYLRARRAGWGRVLARIVDFPSWGRAWGLRTKFLLTIVLINALTGAIVFFTLSALQTREQTQRIRKESMLFAQFSTAQVISDFSNFFYFYYADKFLPGIKTIVATNENLVAVRIISRRTGSVLFDSETASTGSVPTLAQDLPPAEIPAEIEAELKNRDVAARETERGGERLLSVFNTYRNENQEALFLVEYLFGFQTLSRSIQAIRRQILFDLVPSMALGLLIAAAFAQLLISPIRRLATALRRVASGDFDVKVEGERADEIGDLVDAFNGMASELRKKQELRKYLSDSTYRQVMEAAEDPTGSPRLGGTRVAATVLFCDIRGFVAHCENLDAEEITAMLNEYFSEMVDVVYRHGGEVDKFIGDAFLAVFYTGRSVEGTALQSIHCALEMRERLAEFNVRRQALGKRTIEIGVGITHGEIISGPIGAKDRMDFTVIGDVVNLATRIEKLSKAGRHTKIVFSHHVEEKVRGLLEYEELLHAPIQGKEEVIRVFELVRIQDLSTLVAHVEGRDLDVRRRAVALLGHSRNPEAVAHVLAAVSNSDEETRLQAVSALARLVAPDHEAAIEALLSRLKAEPSDKVLASVVAALGRVCVTSPRIIELAPLLDSPNERIVANAIEAMGQTRDPRCSDLILPKLSSRNNRVKANAAMALFAAGHVEVIDSLKPLLMHSDPLMRSSAAFAIGELTLLAQQERLLEAFRARAHGVKLFLGELQECVPMLVSLLKDPEPMVKRQAIVALGKIKDRSAVLPLIDNIDLDKDSKELIQDVASALRSIGSHKLVREVISRLR